MTLNDVGLWFRVIGAVVGLAIVARAVWPIFIERSRQRDADRESASIDEYLDSLERQHNGARK